MGVELRPMTRELCHQLYKDWENDAAIYMDMTKFRPFRYNAAEVDRYFDSRQEPTRRLFAILYRDAPIGELQLKQIDAGKKTCILSIHLQNDSVKGRGFGTEAERLAVGYAFDTLGMDTVFADTVLKNTRSQHVLEKAGFRFCREEGLFRYYRIDRQPSAGPADSQQ